MNQIIIIEPVISMLLLTGVVWVYMYAWRLPYILINNIDPQSIATPELLNAKFPERINNPANNLKNLFELPVVFYVICMFLLSSQKVDVVFLYSAWAYVGLRIVHSLIHCTINVVSFRFAAYFLSSLVLWFMLIRLALVAL